MTTEDTNKPSQVKIKVEFELTFDILHHDAFIIEDIVRYACARIIERKVFAERNDPLIHSGVTITRVEQ